MLTQDNQNEVVILMAEDDDGHAELVRMNFIEAGIHNRILRFHDGQEVLDFFFAETTGRPAYQPGRHYLMLLDIRMPRVDGVTVLEKIKNTPHLKQMPIIMLTTTDDPQEVERCHQLGCNVYVTKPVKFKAFAETLRRLGLFLMVIQVPELNQ